MALDPSILLPSAAVLQSIAQPKPIPSPIELQTQQLALQNARLQSQTNQLQLQQQQREAAAQQATLQAFQDANGDPDQAVANLYKMGLPKQAMDLQTNRVALQKSLADAQKLKLDNQAHVADMLSRSAQNVLDADPAHRAMAYQYYKGQAEQNGWVPPNTLSPVYTPDLDSQLQSMVNQGQSLKDQAITAKNQALRGEAQQKTAAAQQQDVFNTLSAAKNDQELQQGLQKLQARNVPESMLAPYRNVTWTPDLAKQLQTQALTPEQRAQQPKLEAETTAAQVKNAMPRLLNAAGKGPDVWTAALKQESPEVQQFYGSLGSNPSLAEVQRMGMTPAEQIGVGQKAQEIGISRARLGVEQQAQEINRQRWGFEQAGGVSPQAQAIVDGSADPQTVRRMVGNNPGLIGQAKSLDPNFGMDKLDQRYNAIKSLAPGGTGPSHTAALALNTLIHHIDLGMDTADALKNGTFVPGNQIFNAFATTFGQPQTTDFNTIKNFIAGEAAKVAQGGVPHETEVQDAAKAINAANSPDQLKGALQKLLQVAGGRMGPMIQEGKSAGLTNRNSWDPTSSDFTVLQPDSKAVLVKRGFDPNTMKPTGKSGGAAATGVQVGKPITLRNGKTVTVTAIHPDGSFDAK